MRILIVGSGAREHALAETLARSPAGAELYCYGTHRNPGIEALCAEPVHVGDITDPAAVLSLARAPAGSDSSRRGSAPVEIVCIGPEAPLERGVADVLEDAGIPVVGPRREPARIETSKAFCRDLLRTVDPEAIPRYFVCTTPEEAEAALRELGDAYVVKTDGLAGGKGVKVSGDHLTTAVEALEYCREVFSAAPRLVIEEKLVGEEFSLLSFTDGYSCLHMPVVQDHKRAYPGDRGPNTGGMGSYSDANGSLPFLSRQDVVAAQLLNERVVAGIRDTTGIPYRGILYGGFIATARGVAIIEYNARFGDPEALNILPLLESDLVQLFSAITTGALGEMDIRFYPGATVCKYLVPRGYPEKSEKGLPLERGVLEASAANVRVYAGSLSLREETLLPEGSRTMAVTGIGSTLAEAHAVAEHHVDTIDADLVHRRDIGTAALIGKRIEHMNTLRNTPLRVGILGSTRGSSAENLIVAAEARTIPASVEVILSDKEAAPIFDRALRHRIPSHWVNPRDDRGTRKQRQEFDRELIEVLEQYRVDLVLCVGFMRILSDVFCSRYRNRALNVHPSLLPDFAGGMDDDVHHAVIESGRRESGCTVHYITPRVDEGPVLLRMRCEVTEDDTPETLKRRVQGLEREALVAAVQQHHHALRSES